MPAGATYNAIATTTLASAQANLEFSSISSAYTDLVVVYTLIAETASSDMYLRVNNDSATNYSNNILWGNGSTTGSNRFASAAQIRINYVTDVLTTARTTILVCNFNNYSNTTQNKTVTYKAGLGSDGLDYGAGLWRSTSAINRITLFLLSGNWGIGSTATLYGITAA